MENHLVAKNSLEVAGYFRLGLKRTITVQARASCNYKQPPAK